MPLQLIRHRDALSESLLLWVKWDDTVMDDKLVEKLHLGGYSMPKHHSICDELKEDGPWFRWSTRIYLTRVFQEASLQKSQVKYLKVKNEINSKYNIFQHLVFSNTE